MVLVGLQTAAASLQSTPAWSLMGYSSAKSYRISAGVSNAFPRQLREVVRAKVGTAITAGEHVVREFQEPTRELLITFIQRYWAVMLQPTNARLTRLVFSELGNLPELVRFYMAG